MIEWGVVKTSELQENPSTRKNSSYAMNKQSDHTLGKAVQDTRRSISRCLSFCCYPLPAFENPCNANPGPAMPDTVRLVDVLQGDVVENRAFTQDCPRRQGACQGIFPSVRRLTRHVISTLSSLLIRPINQSTRQRCESIIAIMCSNNFDSMAPPRMPNSHWVSTFDTSLLRATPILDLSRAQVRERRL